MEVRMNLSGNFGIGCGFIDFEIPGIAGTFRTRSSNLKNSANVDLLDVLSVVEKNLPFVRSFLSVGVAKSMGFLTEGIYVESVNAWYQCPFNEIGTTGVLITTEDEELSVYFFPYKG